ncbi:putative TRAP-type C4-dicarboxylate transport system, small membrane protein component [anaerobic digester metagenome]|jgi:TRAP-type mannitol/chloroaromatic compound transport system permease small subunit|uniref:Putative TRAP-type C4-dicarboxylate transport system, small membrane protein component n=1 Tax=anaerobic digester metagenome TaxID=1263854 RepID=A0A485LVI6_9ZZZZ
MRTCIRIISKITDVTGHVLMWFPWILTVIIVWELVMRNIFNRPTIWAHEISVMVFAVLTITSGAYALKERAHVNMDLFYTRLSDRGKAIVDIITSPAIFIFAGVLLWLGWEFAVRSYILQERSISTWNPVVWPVKFAIPFGAALLLLQGIAELLKNILTLIEGERKGV